MRKFFFFLGIVVCICSLTLLEARGGRGGGGRGSGARSGHSISRSPSLSRSRPSGSMRPSGPVRPGGPARPGGPSRPSGARSGNLSQRPGVQNRSSQINQLKQRAQARGLNKDQIRQRTQNFDSNRIRNNQAFRNDANRLNQRLNQNRPGYNNNWFNNQFFANHRLNPGYNSNLNLWRGARWAALNNWGAYGWAGGLYYDDDGYPITIAPTEEDNTAYQQTLAPAPSTTPSNLIIADSSTQQTSSDWLPLGVFALSRNAAQASVSNMFLQIALDRSGNLSGTYYNASTDKAYTLSGTVDKETQQAVISSDKPSSPILTTGIYNLTQDETPVKVHFANGTEQTWTLTRLSDRQ